MRIEKSGSKFCNSQGDPYITTFDGAYYLMQFTGTFLMMATEGDRTEVNDCYKFNCNLGLDVVLILFLVLRLKMFLCAYFYHSRA